MRKTTILAVLALSACAAPPSDEAPPSGEAEVPAGPVLPFIADDYAAARAEAQERDLPIFVESWAPW